MRRDVEFNALVRSKEIRVLGRSVELHDHGSAVSLVSRQITPSRFRANRDVPKSR